MKIAYIIIVGLAVLGCMRVYEVTEVQKSQNVALASIYGDLKAIYDMGYALGDDAGRINVLNTKLGRCK